MRKAWLLSDEEYPVTEVLFELQQEGLVELREDEVKLIQRYQKLKVKYDTLCRSLWKRKKGY